MSKEAYRVRTFFDQDESRGMVGMLSARCVQDILYRLDSATGPAGSEYLDTPPDPGISRQYEEFRKWFGPEVGAAIEGLVVGPLLSRLSVDEEGRAYIDEQEYKPFLSIGDRTAARIQWLCVEVPGLIEAYGQLEGREREDAMTAVEQGLVILDRLGDENSRRVATAFLPELERWFMYAQPGSKIMRGDKSSLKALRESLDGVRRRVAELESAQSTVAEKIGRGESGEMDKEALHTELLRVEETIAKMERKLGELDRRREVIIEAVS